MNLAKRILTAFRVTLQKLAPHVKAAIIATGKILILFFQKLYKYGKEQAPHVKAACISFSKRVMPFCQKLYKYSKGLPSHIKSALLVAIAIVAGSFISNCGETSTTRLIKASQGAESSSEYMDARQRKDMIWHFDLMTVAQQTEFLASMKPTAMRMAAESDAPQAEIDAWEEWYDALEAELRSRRKRP